MRTLRRPTPTAKRSNELYRGKPRERGRPALSIAFDLPTQTGYDPDHVLARGEVGKGRRLGRPQKGDMHQLLRRHPGSTR